MCGIFALLNSKNISDNVKLEAFNMGEDRGPEDHRHVKGNNCDLFFHRLAINGLELTSGQPIKINNITLICNGEIYNYKKIYELLDIQPTTNSDCEVIIHLYMKYGIRKTLEMLDGVFGFVLYDETPENNKIYVARDPLGVRPLFMLSPTNNKHYIGLNGKMGFASELKVLYPILRDINNINSHNNYNIVPFLPGTCYEFQRTCELHNNWSVSDIFKYFKVGFNANVFKTYSNQDKIIKDVYNYCFGIHNRLIKAVKHRVEGTTDRPVACLLSGGLDSSLIASIVKRFYKGNLETYSIGMEGSEDLRKARLVANHIGSDHHEIILTKEDFLNAIPEVIQKIESYDTTTVRASVGNYLIGKYIRQHSNAKVIFNGDGSDELTGGYIYMLKSPDSVEFNFECCRLLEDIHYFDVLRSDKSISSNGLEPRTPFLDKDFVKYYLNIPVELRNPRSKTNMNFKFWSGFKETVLRPEKMLLRFAFFLNDRDLLPQEVLWRSKEAFSDGVSGNDGSWYEIISKHLSDYSEGENVELYKHNTPTTNEQIYYRNIFEKHYGGCAKSIPYFWMPKFINATDASARTLDIYNDNNNNVNLKDELDSIYNLEPLVFSDK